MRRCILLNWPESSARPNNARLAKSVHEQPTLCVHPYAPRLPQDAYNALVDAGWRVVRADASLQSEKSDASLDDAGTLRLHPSAISVDYVRGALALQKAFPPKASTHKLNVKQGRIRYDYPDVGTERGPRVRDKWRRFCTQAGEP